jgi:cytochrome c oxidase assembly factor CtaG
MYLFLAMLANDALSAVLAFSDRVLYPAYAFPVPVLGISPLDDQARAGALMWVFGTFVYLVPAVVISIQMLSPACWQRPEQMRIAMGANVARLNGPESEVI